MAHLVFVYGTLKRGQPNFSVMKSSAGQAEFVAEGQTAEKYPLVIASRYNIPYLLAKSGIGHAIKGEIFKVDDPKLKEFDQLENHPDYYTRRQEPIVVDGADSPQLCWTYFLPQFKPELLQLPMLDRYDTTGSHGLPYVESEESQTFERRIAFLSLIEHPSAKLEIFHRLMNMGTEYEQKGEFAQAIAVCRRAIDANPDCPDAHWFLAAMLSHTGEESEVIKSLQAALKLCPDHIASLEGLATVRVGQKKFAEAERLCRHAIQISSKDSSVAFGLMVKLMYYKGDMDGVNEFRKRIPNDAADIGELSTCMQLCCDWDDYKNRMKKLSDVIDQKLRDNDRRNMISAEAATCLPLSLQQQLGIAARFAIMPVRTSVLIKHREFGNGNRLRIGYLYTDATGLPLDWELDGIARLHSPDRVEVFVYCLSNFDALKSATGHLKLRDLSVLGDNFDAAANRIASDCIQILVNIDSLSLHSRKINAIMARKPAPIQVVYRCTLGTTAAPYVDYLITDKVASPLRFAHGYSEKFAYLPNGMFVGSRDPLQVKQNVNRKKCLLRRRFGLPQSPFIFGVRSEPQLIDPNTFECWCKILCRVPCSVVWMMAKCSDVVKSNLENEAERHGVHSSRLVFAPFIGPPKEPFRLDYLADVVLDTPVCNAIGLITFIAAAIPVVTFPMETFSSRLTASMLTSIGCEELIAKNMLFYQEIAVNLGNKPELLAEMKGRMWENLPDSNLFNVDQYYVDLENLYAKMWKRHETGEKPDHIE